MYRILRSAKENLLQTSATKENAVDKIDCYEDLIKVIYNL